MAASSSSKKMMNNELSELVGQLSLEERRLNRQNRGAAAAEARLGQEAHAAHAAYAPPPAAAAAAAHRADVVRNRIHGLQGRIAEIQQARQAHAASRHNRIHRTPHEEHGFQQKKHRQTASTHNLIRRGPSANNDSEDEDDGGARASAHPRAKRGRPQGGATRSSHRNKRNIRKSKQTRRRHK